MSVANTMHLLFIASRIVFGFPSNLEVDKKYLYFLYVLIKSECGMFPKKLTFMS